MTSHPSLALLSLSVAFCFLAAFFRVSQAAGKLNVQLKFYHNLDRQNQTGPLAPVQFRFRVTLFGHFRGSTGSDGRQQLLNYDQSPGTGYNDTTGIVAFANQIGDAAFQSPFTVKLEDRLDRTADLEVTVKEADTAPPVATFSAKLPASATTDSTSIPVKTLTQHVFSTDGKHSLDFTFWFVCLLDSYGPECDRSCMAQDSNVTGHYSCASDTGEKVCLAGWTDPSEDCKTPSEANGVNSTLAAQGAWKENGKLSPGVIALIIVGSIAFLVAVVGCFGLVNLGYDMNRDSEKDPEDWLPGKKSPRKR